MSEAVAAIGRAIVFIESEIKVLDETISLHRDRLTALIEKRDALHSNVVEMKAAAEGIGSEDKATKQEGT